MRENKKTTILLAVFLVVWTLAHGVGIFYGSENIPMHQSYVGDEQSPVNGALHMLEEKSPLGLQNQKVLYYGPVFATLAVPAVITDFAVQVLFKGVRSAEDYKHSIIWNWGGIVAGLHLTAAIASVLGLLLLFYLFLQSRTLNPNMKTRFAFLVLGLVGLNYYFFQTSNFFINWTFIVILLFLQLYAAFRIYETKGKQAIYWWIHGIATIASFGINYVSAIYVVAFVPLAVLLWWKNEDGVRRNMYIYCALMVVAVGVIIAWHPYALIRYFGFIGIGRMAGHLNDTFNPFQSQQTSFGYYLNVIVLNQWPVIVALVLMARSIFMKRFKEHFMWIWMFGSVGLVQFLLFASLTHHEGRYVLTTILMLLLLAGTAFAHYLSLPDRNKYVVTAVWTLFAVYLAFHTVHIGKWIQIYSEGPVEKQVLEEVLALDVNTDEPIAFVQNYILGHVHTKDAYEAFIIKSSEQDTNLYKAILATPLPEQPEPINVRYIYQKEYNENPSVINEYEHVYRFITQRPEELNQFHYMDENLLRLWYWDEYMPYYVKIK